ncbi:hypothetical protein WAF17_02450 [Bernardetia sp. ABR2-2B]|uniref:hypothetical protein n=1 Tax=Bernardetia sp. ABR2-2B TaxID=3127472 RepID=UPI0030D3D095
MIRNDYFDDDTPTDEPHELNGRRRRRRKRKKRSSRSTRRRRRKARKKARKTKRKTRRSKRRTRRRKKGGFFKRVWRGFKRFNPATIAIRNGILAAAKLDLKKMSSRLRYGYLTSTQAKRLGVDMTKHQKIKRALSKLERKFKKLGGRTRNLKKAILKGRGNRDRKVPLSGFSSDDIFVPNIANEELGEVAAATVIAAATPVLVALLKMLSKAGVRTEQDMYPEEQYDDYGYQEEYEEEGGYYDE